METVKGLKKLISTLEKISKEMDSDVETVVEINAKEIERDAKRNAPVDTGKLQQSIGAQKEGDKTYSIASNRTGLAPYDIYVEYGTRFQRSQPFLFPAFFKGRRKFISDLEDLLESKFKKI